MQQFIQKNSVSIIWLSGLVLGILFAHGSETLIASQYRGDIFMPNSSAASILVSSFFPVLISVLLIHFRQRVLFLILLFTRAFIYGYCTAWIPFLQHSNGFLLSGFQLLSGSCCTLLLVYLALCHHDLEQSKLRNLCRIVLISSLFICLLDYFISAILFT